MSYQHKNSSAYTAGYIITCQDSLQIHTHTHTHTHTLGFKVLVLLSDL